MKENPTGIGQEPWQHGAIEPTVADFQTSCMRKIFKTLYLNYHSSTYVTCRHKHFLTETVACLLALIFIQFTKRILKLVDLSPAFEIVNGKLLSKSMGGKCF